MPFTPPWSTELTREHTALGIIDMQKFFTIDKESPWAAPTVLSITPKITQLIKACTRGKTIFTLFKPPEDWQDEHGTWKNYYHHSIGVTADKIDPTAYEIIDTFKNDVMSPLTRLVDKQTASAFYYTNFDDILRARDTTFLILSGIESDYCVLATALDAVSRGYSVVIPMDACGSSKGATGQRNAEAIFERFGGQIWITDTETVTTQLKNARAD
ncbi:MAG: cysteine hydrolase [Pseudomonadota bacterium]